MSTYGLTSADHHPFANNFDKVAAYHNALQNNKANFSVSHLLDLEELPSENCAMYANTDPQPGLPTQACTPTLNGNPTGAGMTDLSNNSPSPIQERMQQPSPSDGKSQSEFCSCLQCSVLKLIFAVLFFLRKNVVLGRIFSPVTRRCVKMCSFTLIKLCLLIYPIRVLIAMSRYI